MITSSEEYNRFLANIAQADPSILKMRIPTTEPIYEINLNTRKISAPPFIGVEGDHKAEYVFFQMDRYFDLIDLSEAIGMIVFKNAKNEEYYQIIPYYDIYSIKGKIIFPWAIQAPAVMYSGTVSFSFKFFKIDPTSQELIYELNTTIANTKVLVGWANTTTNHTYNTLSPESIILDNATLEKLNQILRTAQYTKIYWTDVDFYRDGMIQVDEYEDAHILDNAITNG